MMKFLYTFEIPARLTQPRTVPLPSLPYPPCPRHETQEYHTGGVPYYQRNRYHGI